MKNVIELYQLNYFVKLVSGKETPAAQLVGESEILLNKDIDQRILKPCLAATSLIVRVFWGRGVYSTQICPNAVGQKRPKYH